MNGLAEIEGRKRLLLAKSEAQRLEMASQYYRWQARTTMARQVTGFLKNPLVLSALGLVLLKLPWKRAYRMGGWGLKAWRIVKLVRRFI